MGIRTICVVYVSLKELWPNAFFTAITVTLMRKMCLWSSLEGTLVTFFFFVLVIFPYYLGL